MIYLYNICSNIYDYTKCLFDAIFYVLLVLLLVSFIFHRKIKKNEIRIFLYSAISIMLLGRFLLFVFTDIDCSARYMSPVVIIIIIISAPGCLFASRLPHLKKNWATIIQCILVSVILVVGIGKGVRFKQEKVFVKETFSLIDSFNMKTNHLPEETVLIENTGDLLRLNSHNKKNIKIISIPSHKKVDFNRLMPDKHLLLSNVFFLFRHQNLDDVEILPRLINDVPVDSVEIKKYKYRGTTVSLYKLDMIKLPAEVTSPTFTDISSCSITKVPFRIYLSELVDNINYNTYVIQVRCDYGNCTSDFWQLNSIDRNIKSFDLEIQILNIYNLLIAKKKIQIVIEHGQDKL